MISRANIRYPIDFCREYYAGLVLSAVGTASPVPHQEDTGVDYYCTLIEHEGQRGLVTDLFTVQVKSNLEPWVFKTPESVRWLVAHLLPLFLCVVNRTEGSVSIFHTAPRFYLWAMPPLPDCVNLWPTQDEIGQCTQWEGGTTFSLSAPILTLNVQEAEQQSFRDMAKEVLKFWISVDKANLARMVDGIHSFQMPHEYLTNSPRQYTPRHAVFLTARGYSNTSRFQTLGIPSKKRESGRHTKWTATR